jgi:hypothetical protein
MSDDDAVNNSSILYMLTECSLAGSVFFFGGTYTLGVEFQT